MLEVIKEIWLSMLDIIEAIDDVFNDFDDFGGPHWAVVTK